MYQHQLPSQPFPRSRFSELLCRYVLPLLAPRPLSLFEGRAGLLCLLADLMADDGGSTGARFPAFELPA